MKPSPDKKQIVDSIAKIATRLGRAPSLLEFSTRARIPRRFVFRFFPKWNDALKAAGLPPRKPNMKIADSELLKDWGEATRKKQGVLPLRAYPLFGRCDASTLAKRFGGWSSIPEAFRKFAKGKPEWADVMALLPAPPSKEELQRLSGNSAFPIPPSQPRHAALKDRAMYGNPIDFRGLRREPVNEQGVVLLFGMLAKDLGYMVEGIQKGFPDCEAMRQVAPERWQRVTIEFEFESKNFRDHHHPLTGCDVIVCWHHNWRQCPEHIEVLDLSRVIGSLST